MQLFRQHNSLRRQEVRRALPKEPPSWLAWTRRKDVLWAILLAVTLGAIAGLTALRAQHRLNYAEGQIVSDSIVARAEFKARNEAATETAKKAAAAREPSVYSPNPAFISFVQDQFNYLASKATDPNVADARQFPASLEMKPEALTRLRSFFAGNGLPQEQWLGLTQQFRDDLLTLAILTPDRALIERNEKNPAYKIVIQHPLGDLEVVRSEILSVDDTIAIRERIDSKAAKLFSPLLPRVIAALISQNTNPTYVFNEEETKLCKQRASDREPVVEKTFRENDVIVAAGRRINAADIELLELERAAYDTKIDQQNPWMPWISGTGLVGLIMLVSASFWAYILVYNPRIAANPMRGIAFTGLVLLAQTAAVSATLAYPRLLFLTATLPTLISGVVLAIAYDRRFALTVGALHTLLIMISLNLPATFGFVLLAGLATAISQLNEVRSRSKLPLTGLWSGLAMALAVFVTGFAARRLDINASLLDSCKEIGHDALFALTTGLAVGLIVQGLLPLIERLFRVTTAMTLKELNETTLPLLRRLAQEAPGTYQHSLRIADMAEAAAQTIGADGLLCRVGAMYHDVGKINKPHYFVENQAGGPNRHEKLSPAMSVLIIMGHVKDGVEMAREYRLPQSIRQFIETHHGTTLVEYFYHAAKQQRGAQDEPAPSEFEFRYAGPKPQTREAAIIMICDGVEGAARAMAEPTHAKLEQLVHNMSQKRLADGQFDECNITLQELNKVVHSIVKTLAAMYHGRIAYPQDADPPQVENEVRPVTAAS